MSYMKMPSPTSLSIEVILTRMCRLPASWDGQATLTGSLGLHLFINCLVTMETAKRKLGLGISILVRVGTRWASTFFTRGRITENPDDQKLLAETSD